MGARQEDGKWGLTMLKYVLYSNCKEFRLVICFWCFGGACHMLHDVAMGDVLIQARWDRDEITRQVAKKIHGWWDSEAEMPEEGLKWDIDMSHKVYMQGECVSRFIFRSWVYTTLYRCTG